MWNRGSGKLDGMRVKEQEEIWTGRGREKANGRLKEECTTVVYMDKDLFEIYATQQAARESGVPLGIS